MQELDDIAAPVLVVGGGRWARVIVETLANLLPADAEIIALSSNNSVGMAAWAASRRFAVRVVSDWRAIGGRRPLAVVIANAARNHADAIAQSISLGAPVLVEKPVTTRYADLLALMTKAELAQVPLASALVLRFASYLPIFSTRIEGLGTPMAIRVCWADSRAEERYGEAKRYDESLPVYLDCLPHAFSVLEALMPCARSALGSVQVARGGARTDISLAVGSVPVSISLERNAERRLRLVEVSTRVGTSCLDFSVEPGRISTPSGEFDGDPEWDRSPRPMAAMLQSFLACATSRQAPDARLSIELALEASAMSDRIDVPYESAQVAWLIAAIRSEAPNANFEDIRYALREIHACAAATGYETDWTINDIIQFIRSADRWALDTIVADRASPRSVLIGHVARFRRGNPI